MSLRDYQTDALDKVRAAFSTGAKRVMLYAPTGSGKTQCAMEMVRSCPGGTLFVCNRVELVSQASGRFMLANIRHGIMQGENSTRVGSVNLIGSVQTLERRGYPYGVNLIIVDEAHCCAASKAYHKLFAHYHDVPVVGLSATPFAKGLGKVFDSLVVAATIRELVELGHLVDVDIYTPSTPDLSGVSITAGDYHQGELGAAVDRPDLIGDIVKHYNRLAGGKQAVVFATNIAHSKHICEQFNGAGIATAHIDAYTPDETRAKILQQLRGGEIRIISNVSVLAEGWDCPQVEVMILARPTRSLIRYIQMAGRVLRPSLNKTRALILDHSGTAIRLGFPTDDLPLRLDLGKPSKASQRQDKEAPKPQLCPGCQFLKPVGVHKCPQCGFLPARQSEIVVSDGTLVKLRRKDSRIDKQDTYSQLLFYASEHGFKPGWAAHKYREIYGSFPVGLRSLHQKVSLELSRWCKSRQIAYSKGQHGQERN